MMGTGRCACWLRFNRACSSRLARAQYEMTHCSPGAVRTLCTQGSEHESSSSCCSAVLGTPRQSSSPRAPGQRRRQPPVAAAAVAAEAGSCSTMRRRWRSLGLRTTRRGRMRQCQRAASRRT
eukprot:scaffold95082_cov33-Tisochrysis_lutea.AAC.2